MEGKRVGKFLEKGGRGVHPLPVLPMTLPMRLAPVGPGRRREYHGKPGGTTKRREKSESTEEKQPNPFRNKY